MLCANAKIRKHRTDAMDTGQCSSVQFLPKVDQGGRGERKDKRSNCKWVLPNQNQMDGK